MTKKKKGRDVKSSIWRKLIQQGRGRGPGTNDHPNLKTERGDRAEPKEKTSERGTRTYLKGI